MLSFSISNRPPWASLSGTTGRLSGTPSIAQAGIYESIQISVSDGMLTRALPSFEIEVEIANRPPVISGSPATSIVEGQSYSFIPTASDPDGDPLTFSVSNRPPWAAFNTATGRLSGTPGAGAVGDYPNIQIRVSDGLLQASLAAFSIDVQAVSQRHRNDELDATDDTHRRIATHEPGGIQAALRQLGRQLLEHDHHPQSGRDHVSGGKPGPGHLLLRDRGLRLERHRKLEHQPAVRNNPVRAPLQAGLEASGRSWPKQLETQRVMTNLAEVCGGALTGAPVPVYDELLAVAQWLEARTGQAGEYGR